MRQSLIAFAVAVAVCMPARASNHDTVSPPIGAGPFKVACSNIAQDEALIAALGSTPAEIWEGRPRDGQARYISQVLAAPGTALQFEAPVPDIRDIYPRLAGENVHYVAIVCHPTPQANADADYVLPGTSDIVPHMQLPGASPRLIGLAEYAATYGIAVDPAMPSSAPARLPLIVFSHGLGGSPVSPGYVDAMVDLASHGFMVAAVFHGDSRFSRIRVEDLGQFVTLLLNFDGFVEMELLRPVSLKSLLDTLLQHAGFAPGIDAERIGGFGASLGGQAVANLLGARLTTSLRLACRDTVTDARVKAAVGLVPYAGQTFLPAFCDDQGGAVAVKRPYLALSGTADTTAPIAMVEQAVNRFQGSRYLVELQGVQHEYLPEYRGDVMTWTVTFLNAYLGVAADPGAIARLIRLKSVTGGPQDALRVDAHIPFPPGPEEALVLEFYNDPLAHYFIAAGADEIASILGGGAGPGWQLTGHAFKAYPRLPADAFTTAVPVCRFYGALAGGPNSHFFTADAPECDLVKRSGGWYYEGTGFYITPVGADGRCPSGYLQVLRAYNQGFPRNDSNHRFTTSDSTWREMERHGWVLEGAVMCARA
ncbi:MAG TPA: hypothetical protein VFV55_03965 [Usitatibacteraceae bacterium]|nr:hypothetical protein [Usitatibacteraceae bacterium]